MPVTSFVLLAAVAASGSTGPTSEANRFVAEWVAAQNAGSFPRYSALYASGFTGVRRSRDKAQTFKLAAWLADRKRMFARPMTVSPAGLRSARCPNASCPCSGCCGKQRAQRAASMVRQRCCSATWIRWPPDGQTSV